MFAIVLAAAAMVSCAGNANKSKAAAHECTEQCEEGKCEKPIEEQCAKCKAATEAAAAAACEGKKACEGEKECDGKKECEAKQACDDCKKK